MNFIDDILLWYPGGLIFIILGGIMLNNSIKGNYPRKELRKPQKIGASVFVIISGVIIIIMSILE